MIVHLFFDNWIHLFNRLTAPGLRIKSSQYFAYCGSNNDTVISGSLRLPHISLSANWDCHN